MKTRIKELRARYDFTQEDLARKVGVRRETIHFIEKGNYAPQTFTTPLELLSLIGNICKHGQDYALHLHAILGDEEKNTFGGHFICGTISITGEIILLKSDINIHRKIDDNTGLITLILD